MKMSIAGSTEVVGPAVARSLILRKALLACGILAALVWLATDIIASMRYAGYEYPFQIISGLSAVEAPTREFVVRLGKVFVVLKIAFAWGMWMSAGQKRMLRISAGLLFASGVNDLVTNFFPWNPTETVGTLNNLMHAILAGGLTVILILLTIGAGASADGWWFRLYSYGTLLVFLVAGSVMAFLGFPQGNVTQPPPWFGLIERVDAYGFMLWMMALAAVLLRAQPESLRGETFNA